MEIIKEIVVNAPVEEVYNAYKCLETWKKVMEDIVDIEVVYDDNIHQEFDMTVKRNSGQETVHSIRFCFPYAAIEIFQTVPPPMFSSMSGCWTFDHHPQGTKLKGIRKFEIIRENKFDPRILEGFLEKNLESFKTAIENGL